MKISIINITYEYKWKCKWYTKAHLIVSMDEPEMLQHKIKEYPCFKDCTLWMHLNKHGIGTMKFIQGDNLNLIEVNGAFLHKIKFASEEIRDSMQLQIFVIKGLISTKVSNNSTLQHICSLQQSTTLYHHNWLGLNFIWR